MTVESEQEDTVDHKWNQETSGHHDGFYSSAKSYKDVFSFSYKDLLGSRADGEKDEEGEPIKRKNTTKEWLTLITLAFANFSVGACVSLQAPFFPKEAEMKGATPTQYGMIFGVYQLTMFIFSPLCGKLMGYFTPKFMLNAGMFIVGAATILFGILDLSPPGTPFIALAFAVRIAEGFGSAFVKTSIYTIIAAEFHERVATIYSGLETFLGLGLIAGPTLGGALYDLGGFELPFISIGVLILIDVVIMYIILPNPGTLKLKGGNLLKFWANPTTILFASLVFTTFNCIGYNQSTLEPHLRDFQLSGVAVGSIFVISGGIYSITAPGWGWLCDRGFNNKLLAIVGCALMGTCYVLIGPAPFIPLDTSIALVCVSLMFFGLGTGGKLVSAFLGVLHHTVINRGFPTDVTTYGLVSSMVASSQSLGAFIGPSLGGYLLQTVGYKPGTLVLVAVEILLIIILSSVLSYQKCNKHKEDGSEEEKKCIIEKNGEP
ncbi:MFS-type transporter SLC18B1-like isoform X1 [Centruroides sculpturatus]|uniref:MFS-type transporter SLC18B1-like isoform X1 n=1 Tax=Centruroides sculpturatus TaxID=218467 RepID=UPI000C6D58B4|nr:MFS-type transporter SLC18B1-like isoform X1 [Centruroides sculpturatus]